jgi:hypothetical protein
MAVSSDYNLDDAGCGMRGIKGKAARVYADFALPLFPSPFYPFLGGIPCFCFSRVVGFFSCHGSKSGDLPSLGRIAVCMRAYYGGW